MVVALVTVGCTSVGTTARVARVNSDLSSFTDGRLELVADVESLRTRRAAVEALLADPLSQESAVRLALIGSPGLQALLATRVAEVNDEAGSGLPGNPVLSYERIRAAGETEIGRLLSVGLLELLSWPQTRRISLAATEAAELRLAVAVIDEVTRVRQAWVRAVAAEQIRLQAERVLVSGEASGELARRMEAAGNFNRITRARQQSYEADARAQAVLARQKALSAREELVRALGLDDADAKRLRLPERLPEVPKEPIAASVVSARATAERFDLRIADAEWRAAALRRGLGTITTLTDIELGVRRDPEARGFEVDVSLPLFDSGRFDRAALDARTLAAANNLEATLRAAGSHLRESYSGYLAAHTLARHHFDEIVPLRNAIAEESLLRYNGMLIGVFELLADAREQSVAVMAAIDAQQQYWLAEAALQSAIVGRPSGVQLQGGAAKSSEAAGGH